MSDLPYELPSPSEKLSYKFIFDAIKSHTLTEPAKEEVEQASPATEEEEAALSSSTVELEVTVTGDGESAPIAEVTLSSEAAIPDDEDREAVPMDSLALPSGQKYFRIKEVSRLVGVEPYVLRYWESEFSSVKPSKSGSGHRVYSRKDVEALHLIRHLLHVEKYSIKGAKRKVLEKRREAKKSAAAPQVSAQEQKQTAMLRELAQQVKSLIHAIQANPGNW